MQRKNLDRKNALYLSAFGMLAGAAALIVITLVMNTQAMSGTYQAFLDKLLELEQIIFELPYKWLIVIAIFLVFLLKNFIPIPTPFICLMTGMVFDLELSVAINTVGFAMLLITKYYWGYRFGGGTALKRLKKFDNVREMLEKPGNGKLAVLAALRIIPSIPVNAVSKIYGGMEFPVGRFLAASLIGFFPKIWSYSYMGGNFAHPFTWKFMAPIVLLLIFSGVVTAAVNLVLEKRKEENKNGEHNAVKE